MKMKMKKQRGGGMHSEYCPLCLLSYEDLPEIEEEEEEDEDEEEEEEEKEENQLKKLSNVDLSWLKNGLAFDRDTNEIIPVEGDDMYGRFPIKGRRKDLFTSEITIGNDGDSGWGPVFHEDCIKCVSAQLNRPVTYEDGIEIFKLVEKRHSSPYQSQHFEWEDAIKEEGPAYFYSPMDARVDELRREVAASEAALAALADSPKKTRKVASKPKQPKQSKPSQPQPQPHPSQQANCALHKTKEECPPTDCVWGKTNRCSKKRKLGN